LARDGIFESGLSSFTLTVTASSLADELVFIGHCCSEPNEKGDGADGRI
jgi:hypothetical protein